VNSKKSNIQLIDFLCILPMLLLYSVLILGGIAYVFIESLGYIPAFGMDFISLEAYVSVIAKTGFFKTFGYSIYIALASTLISSFLGVLLAYFLSITSNDFIKRLKKRILQMGMILPYLYMLFLVIVLFGKTGLLSRILVNIGVIASFDQFPQMIYNRFGTGIIFAYIFKGLPFIAMFLLNTMDHISQTYTNVAHTLGAGHRFVLKKIYLPLSTSSIVWASSILFAYDLAAFDIPYLLETTANPTLGSTLFSFYINPHIELIPESMALNILVLLFGSISVLLYGFLVKRFLNRGVKH